MSRTIKGAKGPGYDYWGRRALSGNCGYGKDVKVRTHRIERRKANIECHQSKTKEQPE